jgi:Protein of unknown function (DUF3604)
LNPGKLIAALALLPLGACTQGRIDNPPRPSAPAVAAPTIADPGDRVVLFGDLHLHTSYSLDASASRTETLPADAYRYAMGEPITYLGKTIQRRTPLDFLAVTDHAEYLGNVRLATQGKLPVPGAGWRELLANHQPGAAMYELMNRTTAGIRGESTPGLSNPALVRTHWQDEIDAAERYNRPGRFTAFVAFEYSPTVGRDHLHRNVIFRGPKYPSMPFAATDSMQPEALWEYANANRASGIESLMIPHNSNLSNGRQFAFTDFAGKPMTRDYIVNRLRNEPLVEITQNKGTSETLPQLSPEDEFADFELLVQGDGDQRGGYVRPGLQRGMQIAEELGANPFRYGFVGASDFHSGASSSEEDNFPGGLGQGDWHELPKTILQDDSPITRGPLANLSASGITGVWADRNTREAIFDALRRRETYATSGPRIRVRLFAGWGDAAPLTSGGDWARRAYRWGVPMGGDLARPPSGARGPSFVVHAARDPKSGNLDRIQIVKLWRQGGKSFEKIYDVAWTGNRTPDANGHVGPVGNTVDVVNATFSNSIGAPELVGTWRDPDFNPADRAAYYARVLEIPTPRWPVYLAKSTGVALSPKVKTWLQERAWSSPVWYQP